MYKDLVKEMANNEIFGILSLLIFAVVFAGALIYVFTIKKDEIKHLEQLPLEDDELEPDIEASVSDHGNDDNVKYVALNF